MIVNRCAAWPVTRTKARALAGLCLAVVMGLSAACGSGLQSRTAAAPSIDRSGYIQTPDSIRLFYRVLGRSGDTVVVLHGGPGLHMQYLVPDLLPLARDHILIFYDQRGGGQSSVPSDTGKLNARYYVRDLEAVRRHFCLERMAVLGHSWGGLLAALYAQRHGDRIARLLLLDSDPPKRIPWWAQFSPRRRLPDADQRRLDSLLVAWRTAADSTGGCRNYWRLYLRGYLATATPVERIRGDVCAAPQSAMLNPDRGYARRGLGDWDVTGSFAHFVFPVLIGHGREDPMPLAGAEAWRDGLPNARLLIVDGAGHFPNAEQPGVFFPAASAFFRGEWPQAASRP